MQRTQLIQMLHEYFPTDSTEIKAKDDILAFIKHNKNCFERSLAEGHIAALALDTKLLKIGSEFGIQQFQKAIFLLQSLPKKR